MRTAMPPAVMAEPDSADLCALARLVHAQTQQQVQNLTIFEQEGRLVVTGRSRSYYVKQLVTQALLMAAPAFPLVNEINVG